MLSYTSVRCTLSFKLILHYVESIVWETPPLIETTKESRVADNDTTVIHIPPSLK